MTSRMLSFAIQHDAAWRLDLDAEESELTIERIRQNRTDEEPWLFNPSASCSGNGRLAGSSYARTQDFDR